jgi:hypothetical protein
VRVRVRVLGCWGWAYLVEGGRRGADEGDLAAVEKVERRVVLALNVHLLATRHEHLVSVRQQLAGADGGVGGVGVRDGVVKHGVAMDVCGGGVDEPALCELST